MEDCSICELDYAEIEKKVLATGPRLFIIDEGMTNFSLPHPDHQITYVRSYKKTGRNDPCPCGSKKKYKKCCYPR